jgi:Ca2+-binding EF-hand superfamily protein
MFDTIDSDRSGSIDMEEFLNSAELGTHISGEVAKALFRALDKDKSGDITLMELLRAAFPDATHAQFQDLTRYVRHFRSRESQAHERIKASLSSHFTKS